MSRAFLIVDVQRAFHPPAAFVRRLERAARAYPCRIYTQFLNPPGSMFRRVLHETACLPGTPETALLLAPQKGDLIFRKRGRYGLTSSQIRTLHRRRIREVTVGGLDTDACVLAVMFSLFDAGIRCHLEERLCWSSTGLHREALAIARTQFRPAKS